jgi:hypothetical protein
MRALLVVALLTLGCDRKDTQGSPGSCPNAYPAGGGCQAANQECPYEKDGQKMKCTCTPDTSGPSTWQCAPL